MQTALALALTLIAPPANLDSKIKAEFEKQNLPGLVIIAEVRGKIVYSKSLGYANLEHKVPMKTSSVHELASVSKQFAAVAMMTLVEQGKVSLTDSISKYIKDAPESWKPITIEHLLTHTSGLPDYLANISDIRLEKTTSQMLKEITAKPLDFPVGTKWEYSNSGYMALGHIIEQVSSKPLATYSKERIFEPLGIKGFHSNDPFALIPGRADGYDKSGQTLGREDYTSRSFCQTADGHLMASGDALIAWGRALQGKKLLKPDSWNRMWTKSPLSGQPNTPDSGYGYGFGVRRENGKLTVSHTGGWLGTTTLLVVGIDEKYTMVVLCNQGGANLRPFGEWVRDERLKPNIK